MKTEWWEIYVGWADSDGLITHYVIDKTQDPEQ